MLPNTPTIIITINSILLTIRSTAMLAYNLPILTSSHDLVMLDECPDETHDQFQIAFIDILASYFKKE